MSTDKLPASWTRVKFGDVVRKVNDRVDPDTAGIERYVAGEHMDTDDLTIRRWGEVGDGYLGPAFHMRFKPGHVLYGSRRTYLRKVAVADFEGITANTTFVLEPSSKDLLPEFLPLVMTTEAFHDHSIKQSKGSVNPYINFSDLTWYEFPLPPVEEQQKIVEVLSAVDALGSRLRGSIGVIGDVEAAIVAQVARTEGAPEQPLQSCCAAPISYGIVQPGLDMPGGIPYVNVEDMTAGPLSRTTLPRTLPAISARHGRTLLQPGDVVVALRGPIGLTAVISEELAGVNLSRGVARLHPTPAVDGGYLALCLSSPTFRAQIRSAATGSTFKELKIGALRELRVPVPSLDRQREIAESVGRVRRAQAATADQIASTVQLRQALLNRLLQGVADVH